MAPELFAGLAIERAHDLGGFVAGLGDEDAVGGNNRAGVARAEGERPRRLEGIFAQLRGPGGPGDLAIAGRAAPLGPGFGGRGVGGANGQRVGADQGESEEETEF